MCSGYALARIRRAFFRYAMAALWRPYAPQRGYVLGLRPCAHTPRFFFATLWPPCGVHTLRSAAMCSGYALARIRRANNAELNDVLASVFQLVKVPLLFR